MQERQLLPCKRYSGTRKFTHRVAIGVCTNLSLQGFFSLRQGNEHFVELACEIYFQTLTMQDASFAQFSRSLIYDSVERKTISASSPRLTGAKLLKAWTLFRTQCDVEASRCNAEASRCNAEASLEVLCSRKTEPTLQIPKKAPPVFLTLFRPAILAASIPFASAKAKRVYNMTGDMQFVFSMCRVHSVFELVRAAGQSVYLCIMKEDTAPPIRGSECTRLLLPLENEYFSDYTSRLWQNAAELTAGSLQEIVAIAFPEIVLVHCMVDCDPKDVWKLYGMPMEIIDLLFRLVVGSGITSSVRDASSERPHEWQIFRAILPAIHIGVHPEFGLSVSGYQIDDGAQKSPSDDDHQKWKEQFSEKTATLPPSPICGGATKMPIPCVVLYFGL